ncbi:MAG: uracil-DNA glycosylase, partial [Desulfobacca sp.]|nr:uracil-DNA glycosylase [Desulfobacca sp.]
MFVGVGPGEEDDRQGNSFVGPDGQLLTKMIQAIQLTRE